MRRDVADRRDRLRGPQAGRPARLDHAGPPIAAHARRAAGRHAMIVDYEQIAAALQPEATLVIGALLVLGFDLTLGRRWSEPQRLRAAVSIALIALAGAVHGAFEAGVDGPAFGGVFALDSLALGTRIGVLLLAAF